MESLTSSHQDKLLPPRTSSHQDKVPTRTSPHRGQIRSHLDKFSPGQGPTRTRPHRGQVPIRTSYHQDKLPSGQGPSRRSSHHLGQVPTRTRYHQQNFEIGQVPFTTKNMSNEDTGNRIRSRKEGHVENVWFEHFFKRKCHVMNANIRNFVRTPWLFKLIVSHMV